MYQLNPILRSALFCILTMPVWAVDVPFGAAVPINVSFVGARVIVFADMDGDGDLDAVGSAQSAGKVSWFENTAGNGSAWTERVIQSSVPNVSHVVVADFNRDGHLDVAATSQTGGTVEWYENSGNPQSSPWAAHGVATGLLIPTALTAVDLDGDGNIDLAGSTFIGNEIIWWRNSGDPANDSAWTQQIIDGTGGFLDSTLNQPRDVRPFDVDGDGDPDLLVAAALSQEFVWYENQGTGLGGLAWARHGIAAGIAGARGIYAGDFDCDGDLDVVGAAGVGADGEASGALYWFESAGDPTSPANWTERAVANLPGAIGVYVADLNGDGFPDILTSTDKSLVGANQDEAAWWENTAAPGGGIAWVKRTISSTLDRAAFIISADVDRDGDPDVAVMAFGAGDALWFPNKTIHRNAKFPVNHVINSGFLGAQDVFLADINGDCLLDVVAAGNTIDRVVWWANDGTPDVGAWPQTIVDSNFNGASSVYAADIDGDGDLDILATADADGDVKWYENTAGDGSAWVAVTIDGNLGGASSIIAVDVDRDGDLDVVAAGATQDAIRWYENGGNPTVAGDWTQHSVDNSLDGARAVAAGDLNRDGWPDLAAVGQDGNIVKWYSNDGTPADGVTWTAANVSTSVNGASSVDIADVNGDGLLDVAVAAFNTSQVVWFQNGSNGGSWTQRTVTSALSGARSAICRDIDRDGDIDVIVTGENADEVAFFENTNRIGTAWTKRSIRTGFDGACGVAAGDIDGDGDPDVVAAAKNANAAEWFPNRGGQFSLATQDIADGAIPSDSIEGVLKIVATHEGRAGDSGVELDTFELLFEESNNDTLTSGEANAIIASLFVYADANGNGTLELNQDTEVREIATLQLSAGVQTVSFANGDPAVLVTPGAPRTYFVAVQSATNGFQQTPNRFQVTHLTESSSSASDATSGIPLALAFSPNVTSTNTAASDGAPPTVLSATPQDSTTVRVVFNEPMANNAALVTPGNYTFTSGLNAQSVMVVSETSVDVTINEMLQGQNYTLTVSTSVTDASGNPLSPIARTANFTGVGVAPRVSSAVASVGGTTVRLTYNEAMASNAALINAANYTFSGGLIAQSVSQIDAMTVDITTNAMTIGVSYVVTVAPATGITDLAGNALDSAANTANFSGGGQNPQVIGAVAQNATSVRVTYSKEMTNNAALVSTANYTFNGGLSAMSVTRINGTTVDITTPEMIQDFAYTLTVSTAGPTDTGGNPVLAGANTAQFTGIGGRPQVTSAQAQNSTTARIVFSEAMANNAALTTAANYTFNNGLTAASVSRINSTTVDVTTNEMLQGQNYTVTVSLTGPVDLAGNTLAVGANTGQFTGIGVRPQVASAQAQSSTVTRVVFSEAMADNTALVNAANYALTGGLVISQVTRVNATSVDLTTGEMRQGQNYTVTVSTSGPTDLAGNTVASGANTANYSGVGVAPRVSSAAAQSSTVTRVTFNETMADNAALTTPGNYTFTGGLNAISVTRVSAAAVDVTTGEMVQGQVYTLTVSTSGPTDLAGNTVATTANTANYTGIGVAPQVASAQAQGETLVRAVFSEAMANNAALTTAANYTFNGGLTAQSVTRVDAATVQITTTNMNGNFVYTLTVTPNTGITDVAGNPLSAAANTATFSGQGTQPQAASAAAQNPTTVRLIYSKDMANNAALTTAANYTFNGGLTAQSVTRVNATTVDITTGEMVQGFNYTVTVSTSGPTDLGGNFVLAGANTAAFTGVGVRPQVSSAQAIGPAAVRILFNEAMANNAALTTAANYTFNNGITAVSATRVDAVTVDVTTNEMVEGRVYTATVSLTGPTDLAGNTLAPGANTAGFLGLGARPQVTGAAPQSSTVIRVTFSEAMANDAALVNAANYAFSGGLAAQNVTRVNATQADVKTNEMLDGKAYTLTVSTSGPTDLAGNIVAPGANTANFTGLGVKPVITVQGPNPLSVQQGSVYTDAGATALDDVDGNITPQIQVTNNVNTAIPGAYQVTYTVTDSAGNAADPKTRTVNVTATAPPTASATVDILAGPAPITLQLTGSGADPDGGAVTFAWDLDGDGATDTTAQNPQVSFTGTDALGGYAFTLTVTDDESVDSSATAYFTLTEEAVDQAALVLPAPGGTVTVTQGGAATQGVSVAIGPNGALSAPAVIAIGPATNLPALTPQIFGPAIHLGPAGGAFNSPAHVTIPIPGGVILPNPISVAYYDRARSRWLSDGITNVTVAPAGSAVSFDTTHFTVFVVTNPILREDVNLDGRVTSVDVQLTINGALDINVTPYNPDVNEDGRVTSVDVQLVILGALAK